MIERKEGRRRNDFEERLDTTESALTVPQPSPRQFPSKSQHHSQLSDAGVAKERKRDPNELPMPRRMEPSRTSPTRPTTCIQTGPIQVLLHSLTLSTHSIKSFSRGSDASSARMRWPLPTPTHSSLPSPSLPSTPSPPLQSKRTRSKRSVVPVGVLQGGDNVGANGGVVRHRILRCWRWWMQDHGIFASLPVSEIFLARRPTRSRLARSIF